MGVNSYMITTHICIYIYVGMHITDKRTQQLQKFKCGVQERDMPLGIMGVIIRRPPLLNPSVL